MKSSVPSRSQPADPPSRDFNAARWLDSDAVLKSITAIFINIKCKAAYIDCNVTSLQHHKSPDEAIKPGLVVKDVF